MPLTTSAQTVVAEEPANLEAKLALAKCLEQCGDPQRALVLIKEGASFFACSSPQPGAHPYASSQ